MSDEESIQSNSTDSSTVDSIPPPPPPPPPPSDDLQMSALIKGQKNITSKGINFFDFNIKEDE